MLKPLENFITEILKYLYNFIGNYGLSIIAVTIVIKIAILPLTIKQDKSMKAMKKIQPEIEGLKEKYKDNPQEMNKAMMEIYQKNNVNPLGGCLPALIQMPIWISLYNVLQPNNNFIPAGTKFLIWDLTKGDPMFILPAINALIVFVQQKIMTPDSQNNEQAKIMLYTFPIMIFVMSLFVPAGLQIYWITSSAIGFIQQLLIMNVTYDKK